MLLKRVEIENICQHRKLSVDLRPGLVGVIGPCGSGKSNFLACIRASLTNNFSYAGTKKQDKLRRGAETGGTVTTRWSVGSSEFTVKRQIKPNGSWLHADGLKGSLTKQAEIEEYIEKYFGISASVINQYVFINQWDMLAFLRAAPAQRLAEFAHLCRTDHIEKLWQLMGQRYAEDSRRVPSTNVEDLTTLSNRVANLKEQIELLRLDIEVAESQVLTDKETADLERKQQDYYDLRNSRMQLQTVTSQLRGCKKAMQLRQRRTAELKEQMEQAKQAEAELAESARYMKSQESRVAKLQADYDRKVRLTDRLAKLQAQLDGLVEFELSDEQRQIIERRRKIMDKATAMEQEIVAARKSLALFEAEGTTECPTCHTPVEELDGEIDRLKTILRDQPAVLASLTRKLSDATDAEDQRRRWEVTHDKLVREIEQITLELSYLVDAKPPENPDEIRRVLTLHQEREMAAARITRRYEAAAQEEAEEEFEMRRLQKEISLLQDRIAQLSEIEDIADVQERLQASQSARVELASLKARLHGREESLKEWRDRLKAEKQRRREHQRIRQWLKHLAACREVVHRDQLPQLYMQSVLDEIVEDMNDRLDEFECGFNVTSTPDLSFTVHNKDGSAEPALAKSGGESVVLAIAYRLAISKRFAQNVGLLVLDEPTAGLDEHYVDCLADVLTKVNQVTRKSRQQVIMVTHNQRLERVFGQLVRFG